MNLQDLAKIIFTEGVATKDRRIRIVHFTDGKELWSGRARDLSSLTANWIVVEVLVDYNDDSTLGLAYYDRGKILTVI